MTLQTGETDIAQNDILGKIQLTPDEGTGTDAILVALVQDDEGDFSSSSNATTLQFLKQVQVTASETMSYTNFWW